MSSKSINGLTPTLSRSRGFIAHFISVMSLLVFSVAIVVKAWTHISVYTIYWMAFAMFWATLLLFRISRSHGSLRISFAVASANTTDKELPVAKVFHAFEEVSNIALAFSSLALFGMLMAIAWVLFGR